MTAAVTAFEVPMTLSKLSSHEALKMLQAGKPIVGRAIAKLDISHQCFESKVTIKKCSVEFLVAERTRFLGKVDLSETVFGKCAGPEEKKTGEPAPGAEDTDDNASETVHAARLESAEFGGATTFAQARFKGRTSFLSTVFAELADFEQAVFEDTADFSMTKYGGEVIFRNAAFEQHATFEEAEFDSAEFEECRVEGKTNISNAVFHGWADFHGATLGRTLDGSAVKFRRGADFGGVHFRGPTIFEDGCFQSECSFADAQFSRLAVFNRAKLQGHSDFRHCAFADRAEFRGAELTGTLFDGAKFEGPTSFGRAHFEGKYTGFESVEFRARTDFEDVGFDAVSFAKARFADVSFRNGVFRRSTILDGASFDGETDFSSAQFKGSLSLLDVVLERAQLKWTQVRGKLRSDAAGQFRDSMQQYGLLKTVFENGNEYEDMDRAYHMFKRCERKAAGLRERWVRSLMKPLEILFVDWGAGYGTRPRNVVIMTLLVILAFAWFYWLFGGQFALPGRDAAAQGLGFYVYYSFVTFITIGAENVHPVYTDWLKAVVAFEGFTGFFLMTLFVATFTRKIIR